MDYFSQPLIKTVLAATLLFQGLTPALAGKLYRWVDDEGNVHYTDKVPQEHAGSARRELNPRGLTIGETGAARTPEEIAREAELERMRAAQQRQIEKQAQADRVLLRTFRSDDDIEMARNGKLTAIDVLILITRANIKQSKIRLEDMQSNAAQMERSGEPISPRYQKQIEDTRRQLKASYDSILRKEKEKEAISARYDADLARFRSLKQLSARNNVGKPKGPPMVLDTVYRCRDAADCKRAWKRAEAYVEKHATTGIQLHGTHIVMAARPVNDEDVSMTASRIRQAREINETGEARVVDVIFMDLQCRNSTAGQKLCESQAVTALRNGFRSFLGKSD